MATTPATARPATFKLKWSAAPAKVDALDPGALAEVELPPAAATVEAGTVWLAKVEDPPSP
jgi:hypothetical protein